MSGAAHRDRNPEEAVTYVNSVFNLYKTATRVERFYGRMAEIGPGDSCGIGLMFLADGCEEAHLVDRFFSSRDERQQQLINQALVRKLPRLSSRLQNGDFSESSFAGLKRFYGAPAETFFSLHTGYDFIVSCAVMEHLYDPLQALSAIVSALKPGGTTVHQIDCRDHGQFSEHFHQLKFLELPRWMYAPLGWGGGPNRVRLSSYLDTLSRLPVDSTVFVDELAGVPERMPPGTLLEEIPQSTVEASRSYVASVRSHLAHPFRSMCDEDLMITAFTLSARRRAANSCPPGTLHGSSEEPS
jgi:SAM-dependent methyltransferase